MKHIENLWTAAQVYWRTIGITDNEMNENLDKYVSVRVTSQSVCVAANGEVSAKTMSFLRNENDLIKANSLSLTPAFVEPLYVQHLAPEGTYLGEANFEMLYIAKLYDPIQGLEIHLDMSLEVLPPDVKELPLPKKTLDTHKKLENRYQILISHPDAFTQTDTSLPQKATLMFYLDENFNPLLDDVKFIPEKPDLLLSKHEGTEAALGLIVKAACILRVFIEEMSVFGFSISRSFES